jgi:hypothetical protein
LRPFRPLGQLGFGCNHENKVQRREVEVSIAPPSEAA